MSLKYGEIIKQMSLEEKALMMSGKNTWETVDFEKYGIPSMAMSDGPHGLRRQAGAGDHLGLNASLPATCFPTAATIANSWDEKLGEEIGVALAEEAVTMDVNVILGPGLNIKRSPLCGRNFEYYSEDGFLSGKMSAYEVAAIQEKGVHVVMKHFALNDCEQDRIGLGVWLSEQAAREVYLKAFQDVFEEGNANGTMVAYTRWGCIWSGGNKGLMTGIMRNEWGSNGLTITDNVLNPYVNGPDGVMAGGVTTYDAMMPYVTKELPAYKNDPVMVTAMREACHHDLYVLANSVAMNGVGENTTIKFVQPKLLVILKTIATIGVVGFILSLVMFILKKRKFKKSEEYTSYMAWKKELKQNKQNKQ